MALGVAWCYVTAPRVPSLEEAQAPRTSDQDHLLSVRSYASHVNDIDYKMEDRQKRRLTVIRFFQYIVSGRQDISSTSLQLERSELLSTGWFMSLEVLPAGCDHLSLARCVDVTQWEEGETTIGDI